jgi:ligand-binding sensor domain-containing protein
VTRQHFIRTALLGLTVIVPFTSCKGQTGTTVPDASAGEPSTTLNGEPKLIKTQGTGPGANVHCGLQDKAGNLWFGTTGEGVYRYDGKSFANFTVKDGLSHNFVWCVYEDNSGNIWFGTADGACRYDGNTFTRIPISVIRGSNSYSQTSATTTITTDSYGNPSEVNAVWKIMQDTRGRFWLGTSHGLYRYDGVTYTSLLDIDGVVNNTGFGLKKVEALLEDKDGNIWFGGRLSEGMFRFDGTSLTGFRPDGNRWLWPMLEDRSGKLWFSNFGSMYTYDGTSFSNFTRKYGACNNIVAQILEDTSGNFWFGSESEGLCRYDGTSFTRYTTRDGLINNSVFTLVEDNAGNIWVGTRGVGLCRFDGETFARFSE